MELGNGKRQNIMTLFENTGLLKNYQLLRLSLFLFLRTSATSWQYLFVCTLSLSVSEHSFNNSDGNSSPSQSNVSGQGFHRKMLEDSGHG